MRTTYLAYPIDNAGSGDFIRQIERIKSEMLASGEFGAIFDPGDAFTIGSMQVLGTNNPYITDINAVAANRADCVVAFLPRGVTTIGVPMEIDRAVAAGKMVIIVSDIEVAFMLNYRERNVARVPLHDGCGDEVVRTAKHLWANVMQDYQAIDMPEPLPFKLLDSDAKLPTRAYLDDAGFDLYTIGRHVIDPNSWMDVPTGVAMELPSTVWAMLTGRSSTWRNMRLNVIQGIIDPGYRGQLFAGVHNPTDKPIEVPHGTRLAQVILMGNYSAEFAPLAVDQLRPSMRGENGFGSSGSGL